MKYDDSIKMVTATLILTIAASIVCAFINVWCTIICFICGVCIALCVAVISKKRHKKLVELNDYLSLVCAGNFDLNIPDNSEGELSILKNNLYKVMMILQSQNDALKKDKIYLADSIADISHQLKTPLTSMTVMSDLIKTEQSSSKREEFIDIINEQLKRMNWLIQTLLKLSKLDAGTIQLKQENVSISDIIDESIKPFLITLDLKEISITKSIIPYDFKGDFNWTVEAVQNIIKNCIEHTNSNGAITIATSSTTIYNELTISDNGCGISNDDLPHIFERFYHGKNSSSESVGIGLALSKTILAKQNASISVNSTEGAGTEFVIRFYKSVI